MNSERGRRLLASAPGVTWHGDPARIPSSLAARALETAPSDVALYNQRGEFAFQPGIGKGAFGVGVTALRYQDPKTDETVASCQEHFRAMIRLGHTLPSFDVVSTVSIMQDMSPDMADLYAVLEMTVNTTKPRVVLVSDEEWFGDVIRLLAHLHGDLASRPSLLPYFNPITPLVINEAAVHKMLIAIEHGLPLTYPNNGMMGASKPITSGGPGQSPRPRNGRTSSWPPRAQWGLSLLVGDMLGAKAFSPAVVVYANDVIRVARKLGEGFALDDASIGWDEIAAVGPGGTFLETEQTFKLLRAVYQQSEILLHPALEACQERGSPRAEDVLRRYTCDLLEALEPPADYDNLIGRGEAFIRGLRVC